ncbi:polysaccharide deacetylase family protein [Pelosinus sp. IPA-1]|uniref:polysaccharide deacetylase family protein n=1 Tax=Pelosinus sp. IPA-1 TaxID=3029569 RepID=UPI002556CA29|nr:polysaccharide deacetylase family protein [Pelosinus sp. IPA-1]
MIPLKWFLVVRVQRWYILFSAGVFFAIIILSGLLQPIFNNAQSVAKPLPIFHGNAAEPKVAFACNVFWGEEFLPTMLNTLDENNIKITFFIGGSWGKRFPSLVTELANHGHELGNHTYSHPHPNALSKEKNKEQIVRTEDLVKELTTIKTTLYAPPYGEYNDTVLYAANELGYTTIMWSIDTIDWQRPPTEIIISRVMKKLHNGAIILIHPTEVTAKALPELIQQIKNKGYQISTVSDIIK